MSRDDEIRCKGVAEGPSLPCVRVTGAYRRARASRMTAAGTSQSGIARVNAIDAECSALIVSSAIAFLRVQPASP